MLLFVIEPRDVQCVSATLRMATRTVARVYDAELAAAGLRTTQFSILAALHDEGPSAIGHLAGRLAMDRRTLTRELEPLLGSGLVADSRGADRRQRVVELTAEGEDRFRAARPAWKRAQKRIHDAYGERESHELLARLRDLVGVARESA
jgi:DNA-binding MarR family transcriptional regulator